MMHGKVRIPVHLCSDGQVDSTIILSSTIQKRIPLRDLNTTDNVNVTCNGTTCYACFYNVTESFLFIEYCEVQISRDQSTRDFCCDLQWDEFVSRTCVNVVGGGGKLTLTVATQL